MTNSTVPLQDQLAALYEMPFKAALASVYGRDIEDGEKQRLHRLIGARFLSKFPLLNKSKGWGEIRNCIFPLGGIAEQINLVYGNFEPDDIVTQQILLNFPCFEGDYQYENVLNAGEGRFFYHRDNYNVWTSFSGAIVAKLGKWIVLEPLPEGAFPYGTPMFGPESDDGYFGSKTQLDLWPDFGHIDFKTFAHPYYKRDWWEPIALNSPEDVYPEHQLPVYYGMLPSKLSSLTTQGWTIDGIWHSPTANSARIFMKPRKKS